MDSSILQMASYAISTATILSSLFLKVPQIMNIQQRKSTEGIYLQAMLMEITSFSIVTLYNFTNDYSFMTYLEYPIILLQLYVLVYYVLKYDNLLSMKLLPYLMMYILLIIGFALQILPKSILWYILPLCTPMGGFAKVTYIYGIVKARNADAVSLTTWVISICTNLARLFTVYVDSGDNKLMVNFLISSMLSLGVLLTALYYQRFFNNSPETMYEMDGEKESYKEKTDEIKEDTNFRKRKHHTDGHHHHRQHHQHQ